MHLGKKKPSGSENRKRIKENAQKNDLLIAKMPKLQNYFTTVTRGNEIDKYVVY